MAQITITEILGSDSMAASRPVIQSNFKILADEANKIETFLNTSEVGGSLSIGLVKINNKNKDNLDEVLLNCEGSAAFSGNVSIDEKLTIFGGLTIENSSEETILGSSASVGTFTSLASTTDAIYVNESAANVSEDNISIDGKSMLNIEFGDDSGAGSPTHYQEYNLLNGAPGQVLILTFNNSTTSGTIVFDSGEKFEITTSNTTTGSPVQVDFSKSVAVFYIAGTEDSKKVLLVSASNCDVQ